MHEHSELGAGPVGIIPVGMREKVILARSLGAAGRPVDAARAVVRGSARPQGLLVDENGGVVLGGLRIPGRPGPGHGPGAAAEPGRGTSAEADGAAAAERPGVPRARDGEAAGISLRANKAGAGRGAALPSLCAGWGSQLGRAARAVAAQLYPARNVHGQALRVEADGRLLADLDQPIMLVAAWNAGTRGGSPGGGVGSGGGIGPGGGGIGSGGGVGPDGVSPGGIGPGGLMEVLVSAPSASGGLLRARARQITVTGGLGADFSYEADDTPGGPVHQRTWTVVPAAWQLTVPPAA
ncbi:hypothetical protein [Streptacidiphilus cavernicola]|uniref:Diacylglycerol kinase n=1 Tax=Streptacidiphilus cavernicola TaxID=3342716 RepID=A0ABV6VY08_9ACTN